MTIAFDFERVIRPSSLPMFADCARRSAARSFPALIAWAGYTLRQTDMSVGAAVGSGVHAAAAFSLGRKMETGGADIGSDKDALEAAVTEFDTRISEEGVAWDATTADRGTAHKQLRRMSYVYREVVAPQVMPILVEERLQADVGDGWVVSGQLDSLTQAPGLLVDLKTGTMQRSNIAQYGTYKMVFSAHGFEINAIAEDFVQRVDMRKEQPYPTRTEIPVDVAMAEAWGTIQRVKAMVQSFVDLVSEPTGQPPETAFPANPASVLCSAKYCPAWNTKFCRVHKGAS